MNTANPRNPPPFHSDRNNFTNSIGATSNCQYANTTTIGSQYPPGDKEYSTTLRGTAYKFYDVDLEQARDHPNRLRRTYMQEAGTGDRLLYTSYEHGLSWKRGYVSPYDKLATTKTIDIELATSRREAERNIHLIREREAAAINNRSVPSAHAPKYNSIGDPTFIIRTVKHERYPVISHGDSQYSMYR